MKRYLMILVAMLCFGISVSAQDKAVSLARKYSSALADKLMGEISRNTGRNSDYDLDYESIIYDSYSNEIECLVRITWDAKRTMLFGEYKQCIVDGKLYIYLNEKDSNNRVKTKFVTKWQNDHAKDCAASHGWDIAAASLIYYLSAK